MSKRFLIGAAIALLMGFGLAVFLFLQDKSFHSYDNSPLTKKEINEKLAAFNAEPEQTNAAAQASHKIHKQMTVGKDLANSERFNLIYPNNFQRLDEQESARRQRNAERGGL